MRLIKLTLIVGLYFLAQSLIILGVIAQTDNPQIIVYIPEYTEIGAGLSAVIPVKIRCPETRCTFFTVAVSFDPNVIRIDDDDLSAGEFSNEQPSSSLGLGPNILTVGSAIDANNQDGVLFNLHITAQQPVTSSSFNLTLVKIDDPVVVNSSGLPTVLISGIVSVVTATSTPTLTPSYTPSLTPTPTSTATPALKVNWSQDTHIFDAPDVDASTIDVLPAGESLGVVSFLDDGEWVQVILADGRFGWGKVNVYTNYNGDRGLVPLVTLTPTPSSTMTLTPSLTNTPSPTFTNTPFPQSVRITGDVVNIRAEASRSSAKVGTAYVGDVFGFLEAHPSNPWFKIQWNPGIEAWVNAEFAEVVIHQSDGAFIVATPAYSFPATSCTKWSPGQTLGIRPLSPSPDVFLLNSPQGRTVEAKLIRDSRVQVVQNSYRLYVGGQCWYRVRVTNGVDVGKVGWVEEPRLRNPE